MNDTELFDSFDEFENIWKDLENLKVNSCEHNKKEHDLVQQRCVNPRCSSQSFTFTKNEYSCTECFSVQNKTFDNNAEWRYFGVEDSKTSNPTRCGMPINDLMPKSSMGTVIGTENTSNKYYAFSRMRNFQLWNSMPYKERSLFSILSNINIQAGNNGLSHSIIEDAKVLYKKLSEEKISRGENRNGLIASSIYMSCKSNNVPRSAKEVAKMFNLNISTMTKGCKRFSEILDINYVSTTPEDFIKRFCTKLNQSKIIDLCLYIIEKANEFAIVAENAPPSISSGVIYLVTVICNLDLTKKRISEVCEISEVTINKCFKKLFDFKEHLIPCEIISEYNERRLKEELNHQNEVNEAKRLKELKKSLKTPQSKSKPKPKKKL